MRLELTRRLSHAPQTCLSTYSSTLAYKYSMLNHYNQRAFFCQGSFCRILWFSCRFVNDVLHIGEGKKDSFRRLPVERSHGKVVVMPLTNGKLFSKIVKGIEGMPTAISQCFSHSIFPCSFMPHPLSVRSYYFPATDGSPLLRPTSWRRSPPV